MSYTSRSISVTSNTPSFVSTNAYVPSLLGYYYPPCVYTGVGEKPASIYSAGGFALLYISVYYITSFTLIELSVSSSFIYFLSYFI